MDVRTRWRLVLALLAFSVLAGSGVAFYFTLQPRGDTGKVVVNGKDYYWDRLFQSFNTVRFTAGGESYIGVRLSDLINDTGLSNPENHRYRIRGSDGYEKELSWDDMVCGYLVKEEKKTVFPNLTRSFWVRDVITIEVI
ncbi:MAG: hypothetical protein QXH42_07140 [Thermoplasmata archaeon]